MSVDESIARALWFEDCRVASIRTERVSPPGDDEIQVKAICSLVSQGSELNFYRGEGNLPNLLLPTASGTLPFPIKFAYQTVGRVERAGRSSGYAPGDLVFCRHPHQSRFTISAKGSLVERLPPESDPTRAVFTSMCTIGVHTLLTVPVRIGDCVAVSGLGLIGTFTACLTRKTAGRLVLIDPLAERRKGAEWIGADAVVSPSEAPAVIAEMTEGRGVDIYTETSGAPAALQAAIHATGDFGTIAVPAWYGSRPVNLSLSPEFHLRAQRLVSVQIGKMGGDLGARWTPSRRFLTALSVVNEIDLKRLVTHRFPFDDAPRAYRLLDEKPEEMLGVVLEY